MCVGKTTLFDSLSRSLAETCTALPELVATNHKIEVTSCDDFYFQNDRLKFRLIEIANTPSVITDRSVLSTIAYAMATGSISNNIAQSLLTSFLSNAPKLNLLYLDRNPLDSFETAYSHPARKLTGAWASSSSVSAIHRSFLALYEIIPRLNLDHNIIKYCSDCYQKKPDLLESLCLTSLLKDSFVPSQNEHQHHC